MRSTSSIVAELASARGVLRNGGEVSAYADDGPGPPVLLIPGFLVGDQSLGVVADQLAAAGFQPCRAGITRNVDCSEAAVSRLSERLTRIASEHGQRVAIVGHSRGGMFAQVLARRHPELTAAVVTIATPQRDPLALHPALLVPALSLGAIGALGVRGLVRYSCAFGHCCRRFRADLAPPVADAVPYLAVYSRRDGFVEWRACRDPYGRDLEVSASHCAMAGNPVTLHHMIDFLSRHHAPRRESVAAAA